MKRSFRAGALAIALAAGSALVVPLALPASAAALKPTVTCKTQSSPPLSKGASTSTFAGCTPAAFKLGGTGKTPKTPPVGTKKGQIALVITWKGGKGTTAMSIGFTTSPSAGKCKKGQVRLIAVGKVISSTGAAKALIKKGEPVTAHTCLIGSGAKAGQSSLEPGSAFKL